MKQYRARLSNGRFTRNTLENTFGLHCDICPKCNGCIPYGVNEAPPQKCHHCGEKLNGGNK